MKEFNSNDFINSVRNIQQLMSENRDYLIELDSAIGDGDLGLTMQKGFSAGVRATESCLDTDLGILFKNVGFAISKAAPSTMGTLMATGFIGAGKLLIGVERANAKQIGHIFMKMADSISERGKAKEGEKTLLDVLYPVGRTVDTCDSDDVSVIMQVALNQAKTSLEETKGLISQRGKAAVFRDKTIGLLDPGAVAICFMIEGFANACKESSK